MVGFPAPVQDFQAYKPLGFARVMGTMLMEGSFTITGWPMCVCSGAWSLLLSDMGSTIVSGPIGQNAQILGFPSLPQLLLTVKTACGNCIPVVVWDTSVYFNQTFGSFDYTVSLRITWCMEHPFDAFLLSPVLHRCGCDPLSLWIYSEVAKIQNCFLSAQIILVTGRARSCSHSQSWHHLYSYQNILCSTGWF